MADIKVGEELLDIVAKIDKNKELVDEALKLYVSIMSEFQEQYMGQASDNIKLFASSEMQHIQSLANFYGKASAYVAYAYRQMHFTDEKISQSIENGIQSEASNNG